MAEKPSLDEFCGICDHQFGYHYTTYDGQRSGCKWEEDDQKDRKVYRCRRCPGFARIIRYLEP